MKTLLIALNASYTHTNLAVRYLSAAAQCPFYESNINQKEEILLEEILAHPADLYCFSCYIWNIELVLRLSQSLGQLRPDALIALGGPEVCFRAQALLDAYPFVDYILCGEGEQLLPEWLQALPRGAFVSGALGREGGDDVYRIVEDLDTLPFAYDEIPKNRIIYYEMSRGCPFSCTYCLSGSATGQGVRRLSLARIQADLLRLSGANVKVIKLVDRTFNADKAFVKQILPFVLAHTGEVTFHFEIGADLLDDELLALLSSAPPGKLQLEAGVQTCNAATLELVKRKTDLKRLQKNVKAIVDAGNIHLHLDLIAGLPAEDLTSFARSFDMVYALRPDMLQLGFLKLLYGSELRTCAGQHGILYQAAPPYRVLQTDHLSAQDLFLLRGIGELVERYYNSGRCQHALEYLTGQFASAFDCFARLHAFVGAGAQRPMSARAQLDLLAAFAREHCDPTWFLCLLKWDYYQSGAKGNVPECFGDIRLPFSGRQLRRTLGLPAGATLDLLPQNPQTGEKAQTLLVLDAPTENPGKKPDIRWVKLEKS